MLQSLHIGVILGAIGLVLLHDFIGLVWVVGIKKQFSERFLRTEHRLICLAFLGAIGTGIAMAISKPEVIRHSGFWLKMLFVAMIGLNGYFMGEKCGILAEQRFRNLTGRTKISLSASVVLSLFLWLSTALIGLFVMHSDI